MRRSHRSILLSILILVGGLATPALSTSARAPVRVQSLPGNEVIIYAAHTDLPPSRVPPPDVFFQRKKGVGAQTATFQVIFHGFPPEAQTAFQFAADIWAALITSSVPIVVDATWTSVGFPTGAIGGAGPRTSLANFTGAPMTGTWYPIATANKLAGTDIVSGDYDIRARFNSAFPDWYFGTDGQIPFDKYDFVSVVLHELGHGLGFVGSMEVDNPNSPTIAYWGDTIGYGFPYIYDRYVVNGSDQLLISSFPNNSAQMLGQATSNNLFFNGPNAKAANGGANPKLYAPGSWDPGSSYSHLDESTYPDGNVNALMTPVLFNGVAIHNPGPVTLCLFKDMGWTVVSGSAASASVESAPGFVVFSPDNVTVMVTNTIYLPLIMNSFSTGPC